MNITLDPKWESFINAKVRSGNFPSADAVIETALQWMREQEDFVEFDPQSPIADLQKKQDDLRAAIQIGADQIARGEFCDMTMEQIKEKCRRELAERKKA